MAASKTGGAVRILAVVASSLLVQHPSRADYVPNEMQVSAEKQLVDFEFSQTRAQLVWVDSAGGLWLGNVDRDTGFFTPPDGRALLIDPAAMTVRDISIVGTGPEWVKAAAGDQIAYTKFPAGKPHTPRTARIVIAKQDDTGRWQFEYLLPDVPRIAPYGSEDDSDPAPRISYADNQGNHFWRETGPNDPEHPFAFVAPKETPVRHVRGARALLFSKTVDGISQVHYYDEDTDTATQLTFDDGAKTASWMWRAPEFGNEFVLVTMAHEAIRVYRQLPVGDGTQKWTQINLIQPPQDDKIFSLEPFVYAGQSYLFMAMSVPPNSFSSELWIAGVDAANPVFKRISPETPLRARGDPEVFITTQGPRIYYKRSPVDPSPCYKVQCSEGVWMADPGLSPSP
jgi:hypothetical protein